MARFDIKDHGFSLIELLVIIVVIGLFAAIIMQRMSSSLDDFRKVGTEREMTRLAMAIAGDPRITSAGIRSDFGYIGDIGAFPPNLAALAENPGGWPTWHGPYIDITVAQDSLGYSRDAWGVPYQYSGVEIVSNGGSDTIRKTIAPSRSDYLLNSYRGTIRDAANNPPGNDYADSIRLEITIPVDSGNTAVKSYLPDSAGEFTLDSLPVGTHQLKIIFVPNVDTLNRYITILPRHKTPGQYRFASILFSSEDTTGTVTGDESIILSTAGNANLGGVNFDNNDLLEYFPETDLAAEFLDATTFLHQNENVNAFGVLDNGNVILSCDDNFRIPPLNAGDDDLAEYDPETGDASGFFSGSRFSQGNEDIDAAAVLSNGHIVLSTEGSARIGSQSFDDGDLVEYDPVGGSVSILFNENRFDYDEDIDAVHVFDDGLIVFSTRGDASIDGLSFTPADLVAYDPVGDSAWMFFRGYAHFSNDDEDIDAVSIGEDARRSYEHLIVVRHSVTPNDCDELEFEIENFTGEDIVITGLTLTWSNPVAYFDEVEWNDHEVFDAGGTRPGSGDNINFSSPRTISNNSSAAIEIQEFRNSPSGGSSVDMDNTTFTLELSDGTILQLTTGDCDD